MSLSPFLSVSSSKSASIHLSVSFSVSVAPFFLYLSLLPLAGVRAVRAAPMLVLWLFSGLGASLFSVSSSGEGQWGRCCLLLSPQGSVYSWGAADCVGDGSGCCAYSPKELLLLQALEASHAKGVSSPVCRRVAAKGGLSLALMVGGQLLGWGRLLHARFSLFPRLLFHFALSHRVLQLAIGSAFVLALTGTNTSPSALAAASLS